MEVFMFQRQSVKAQQGFTMIELIMVIVILGVLSAFALPRFADLGGDARTAAVEGAAGSIRSSMGIARAAAFASGTSVSAPTNTISLDGVVINQAYGYPAAGDGTVPDSAGIILAAGFIQPGDTAVSNEFKNGDFTITSSSAGEVTLSMRANCFITYTGGDLDLGADAAPGGTGVNEDKVTPAKVETNVSDC